ncbi:hypothetical protein Tco_0420145, partial [Tanacetum coccineum]
DALRALACSWNRSKYHQSLGADNGSSLLIYSIPVLSVAQITLSSRKAPIVKVPVLQVQHQVPNQFETPQVASFQTCLQPLLQ